MVKRAAKKIPAKRTAQTTESAEPARKAPAKKTARRGVVADNTAQPRKKVPAKVAVTQDEDVEERGGREKGLHGFVIGTDTAIIAEELIAGGASRSTIAAAAERRIKKSSGLTTRVGGAKNVPGLLSGVLRRLLEAGFTVESHYQVIPPPEIQEAMEAERAEQEKQAKLEARRAARAAARKAG